MEQFAWNEEPLKALEAYVGVSRLSQTPKVVILLRNHISPEWIAPLRAWMHNTNTCAHK